MDTENNLRKIKVYCYEHQTTCEVKAKPQIVCTIEEHTLSNDFPYADFWEFCTDCQTFLPTKPDVSGKVAASCPNCDRAAAARFVCQHCKIAAFDSDEPAKGKTYHLRSASGIEPNCPGCQSVSQNGAVILHKCKEIKSEFFTSRSDCPFCLEKTNQAVQVQEKAPDKAFSANPGQCPQCRAWNPPTAAFCGKCKHQLRTDVAVSNLGTDINKSQLLGSLCPNCSTPVPPDSDFCGECGQAVKKAVPPPPPPPPKKIKENIGEPSTINPPFSPPSASMSNTTRNVVIVIGGFFLFIVISMAVANISKSSGVSTNTSNSYSNSTVNSRPSNSRSSNMSSPSNIPVSKTPNQSSSDGRIGQTGTLNMDTNIRESASKDSSWMGTHYRGAKVKILDVATMPSSYGGNVDWFKIEVTAYGNSMDPAKYGEYGKDPGSGDVGWVNSYPEVYEGNRKVRRFLISFD